MAREQTPLSQDTRHSSWEAVLGAGCQSWVAKVRSGSPSTQLGGAPLYPVRGMSTYSTTYRIIKVQRYL